MAGETVDEPAFGQVSRLKGVVFRWVNFAASWVGVVALFVLLLYVLYDALDLATASAAWFGAFGVFLVAPGAAATWYYYRTPVAGRTGLLSLGVMVGGTAAGFAVLVLALVVEPAVWFAYALTFVAPTALTAAVGYGRGLPERPRARLAVLPVAAAGLLVGAVATGAVTGATAVHWAGELAVVGAAGAALLVAGSRRPRFGSVGAQSLGAIALGVLVGFGLLGLDTTFALGLPADRVVYGAAVAAALVGVVAAVALSEEPTPGAFAGLLVPPALAAAGVVGQAVGDLLAPALGGVVGALGGVVAAAVPGTWWTYLLTLVVPGGVVAGVLARERDLLPAEAGPLPAALADWRAVPLAVLAAAFAGSALVGPLESLVGTWLFDTLDGSIWLVFLLTLVVPTGLFWTHVLRHRPAGRAGLAAPAIAVGGFLLAEAAVELLGVTEPATWVDWQYVTSGPSSTPEEAGLYLGIIGSVFVIALVALFTFPLGVGAAIYLEEYAPEAGLGGTLAKVVQVNISNLAGVPSVVYGILGLVLFVNLVGLGFGTVIVGALTLSLLILPIVIISAQEAIRSVPESTKQASYGMGATRWQTIKNVVLPESLPGILTGTILALGRAIGETAPLIMVGMPHSFFGNIGGPLSKAPVMPLHIFNWAFRPEAEFRHGVVAAGVVVLLAVLLTMNSVAIMVRNRYQRRT